MRFPCRHVALPAALAVVALGALAVAGAARAQTLSFGVSGTLTDLSSPPAPAGERLSVSVQNARVQGTRVDLGLAYDGGREGAVQLDFGVQANDTFGPLGNVVGEGRLSLRTDAQAQGDVAVRGVLGPVALGLRLSAFTADPARFDPLAIGGTQRPDFGSGGFGTALDASGRPSRTVVLEADPELYVVPAGVAARATARVRFLRAVGRNELSIRALGYLAPHATALDAAVGVGMTVKRRRAPDVDGAVYLGWSPDGLAPGATARLGQQLGPVLASLTLAAEPYRLDVPAYRATLGLDFPLGPGDAHVDGAGALDSGSLSGTLGVRYALPVTLAE